MIRNVHKCWKCKTKTETGECFGKHITKPFAMAVNVQVFGLCATCQKKLLNQLEEVMQEFNAAPPPNQQKLNPERKVR